MLAACLGLALLLPGQEPPDATATATAQVTAEALEVLDEPDALAFVTGRLKRGDHVQVREELPAGWLAIEPPRNSFGWIAQDAIEETGGHRARVVAQRASIRAGLPGGRMPGRPRATAEQGETVTLLDRPPLRLRQGNTVRLWRAIAPLPGEVRYIRAEGIRRVGEPPAAVAEPLEPDPEPGPATPAPAAVRRAAGRAEPLDRSLLMIAPLQVEGPFSSELAAALARIEAQHRSVLRQPVEQWNLDGVKQRYQELLEKQTEPGPRNALRGRLAQVERQQSLARSARALQTALGRSRQLDGQIARVEQRGEEPTPPPAKPYDAEGLVQTSSRLDEGQALFALIGRKGQTLAYLKLPPGLDGREILTRRVGVHGRVRYNELLRAKLIEVRDLDILSEPP